MPESQTASLDDEMWRTGFLRWRAVWVKADGSLVVNINRYAARSWEGYDPEKACSDAAESRPGFPDWTGQTIVVRQQFPWDDTEAKELAAAALREASRG
jgi:hypothetical protein